MLDNGLIFSKWLCSNIFKVFVPLTWLFELHGYSAPKSRHISLISIIIWYKIICICNFQPLWIVLSSGKEMVWLLKLKRTRIKTKSSNLLKLKKLEGIFLYKAYSHHTKKVCVSSPFSWSFWSLLSLTIRFSKF